MLDTLTKFIKNIAAHHTTQFVELKDNVAHTMDVKNLVVKWMHK